jgi:hypothetical protein
MSTIEEGKIQIIQAPQRGRQAEPIPEEIVKGVLTSLGQLEKGQVVSTGRFFEKQHQAQAYGRRLLDTLEQENAEYRDKLGTSVIPAERDREGKPKAFVLAVRKAA